MSVLQEFTFQCGDIVFSVYKRSESEAWLAAESSALVAVSPARLELVDVLPFNPADADGEE